MRLAIPQVVIVFCLFAGGIGNASAQSTLPDFDDLSRRASAALQTNPGEAAKLYLQAVTLKPSWAEGWFYLGASSYQLKQYTDARDAFQRATTLAADNGASWAFLGLSEEQLKQHAPALEHILKAEALGLPDNLAFVSSVRVCAASIYLRAAEYSMAVQQLEPLARAGGNSPIVIAALGVTSLGMAVQPCDVPAAKRPLVDLAGRAVWEMYAHHTEDAGKLFQELEAKYPREPGVHYVCGVYLLDHDPKGSIDEFRKELAISPNHVSARVQIAMQEINGGNAQSAIKPAREAVKLAPKSLLAHVALGRALLDTKSTTEALHEFEIASKLAPDYPHTHFYMAQVYRTTGNTAEAQKQMAEFARLKAAQPETSDDSASGPGTSAQ